MFSGLFADSCQVKAGDAFTGGLAYYMAQGKTILEATELANYVAVLSVTKKGAQSSMPTLNEVEIFIKKSKPAGSENKIASYN